MNKRKDNLGRKLKEGEYQKQNGRYEYRYVDAFSGKTRSVYSYRLTEADVTPDGKRRDISLREKERQIRSCEAVGIDSHAADRMTLNALHERYMVLQEGKGLRETTRALYRNSYDRYVRNALGSRSIASIKYSQIQAFYISLIHDKGLSVSTLVPLNAVIHSMFDLAVKDQIISTNPSNGVLGELKKSSKKSGKKRARRKSLTPEQQKRFLEYIMTNERYERWRLMLIVLFGTGLRVGELFGLTWADVDFKGNVIHVNRSLGYGKRLNEKCRHFINPPKTEAGSREIPMMQSVRDTLWDEYGLQSLTGFCGVTVDGVSGFIFWKRNTGSLYTDTEIDAAIKRAVREYNQKEKLRAATEGREAVILPEFSVHCIRHTLASRLVAVEPNVKVVQELLGHSSAAMTLDVYAEAMPEDKTETMRKLDSIAG